MEFWEVRDSAAHSPARIAPHTRAQLCCSLGREVTLEQAAQGLKNLDANGDGVVDFEDFCKWWVPFEQRQKERQRQMEEERRKAYEAKRAEEEGTWSLVHL